MKLNTLVLTGLIVLCASPLAAQAGRTTHFGWDGAVCHEYTATGAQIDVTPDQDDCRKEAPTHIDWARDNAYTQTVACAELTPGNAVLKWLDGDLCRLHAFSNHARSTYFNWDGAACHEYTYSGGGQVDATPDANQCRKAAPTHFGWARDNAYTQTVACAELTPAGAVIQWENTDRCRYAMNTPSDFGGVLKSLQAARSSALDDAVAELDSPKAAAADSALTGRSPGATGMGVVSVQ